MNRNVRLIVYPVKDITAAKKLFGKFLDTEPYVDGPYYVGYKVGDLEIGLDPNGQSQGVDSPIAYADVGDIKESLRTLVDAGATLMQDIRDVGGGLLVASVKDTDGNILGLRQQVLPQ